MPAPCTRRGGDAAGQSDPRLLFPHRRAGGTGRSDSDPPAGRVSRPADPLQIRRCLLRESCSRTAKGTVKASGRATWLWESRREGGGEERARPLPYSPHPHRPPSPPAGARPARNGTEAGPGGRAGPSQRRDRASAACERWVPGPEGATSVAWRTRMEVYGHCAAGSPAASRRASNSKSNFYPSTENEPIIDH